MTCATVRDLLHRQLDGDPDLATLPADVAAHLVICAACRAFQSDLERISHLVQHLPPETAPASMTRRIMERLPEHRPAGRLAWLRQHAAQAWAPVAGTAGVLILAYQVAVSRGVSLLNLPGAVAEWAGLVDLNDPATLVGATSAFGLSVEDALLVGVSLVLVAAFALLVQAMSRPPAVGLENKTWRPGGAYS